MYVCRYGHCKLGGKVDKQQAVKDGRMYYHAECYKKQVVKRELREFLVAKNMGQRDTNIMLKKAIDDIGYDIDYVKYVVYKKCDTIKTPYNILYHLKIEKNYKDFMQTKNLETQVKVNTCIHDVETNKDQEFLYRSAKHSRYDIY